MLGAAGALTAAAALTACGPSPVDMTEHPVTTTPTRAAGQQLQRSADPEDACATPPVAPEGGSSRHEVRSAGGDVTVPGAPARVLALGVGAVDTACLLGLQGAVVATAPLPSGSDAYLPTPLVSKPVVDPAGGGEAIRAARGLRPDLVLLPASAGREAARAWSDLAPTVVYDDDPRNWSDAVETLSEAYGRGRAGHDALLHFLGSTRAVGTGTSARDTEVSLVDMGDGVGHEPALTPAGTLGSVLLESVGAGRPPAQTVREGRRVPPPESRPVVGDEFSGDVVYAVLGDCPTCDSHAREVFTSQRWRDMAPVEAHRLFVVDRAVWEGDGLVAARAVLGDIKETINGVASTG